MNTNTPVILFVDDEKYWLKRTAKTLERFDYKILTAISASEGKAILRDGGVHVLLLDLDLPGENGLDILRWTKEHYPHIEVIMYSGEGTIGTALQSIKMGAYDFIEKNSDVEELLVTIRNAVEKSYLEFQILEAEHGLIGRSEVVQNLWKDIQRYALTDDIVLITGESGTGKDLVAKAIHKLSKRKKQPFSRVTCPVITESLGTSELFGYKRGAFANAYQDSPGKFKIADKGTIFLDEMADLPLSLQAKLLTILEIGEIEPVGGKFPEKVDVRVIAATNRDLITEVKKGNFREDLYNRLEVFTIHVPPMRERRGDIPLLMNHFLKEEAIESDFPTRTIEPDAMEFLQNHDWSKNVRGLQHIAKRLVADFNKPVITIQDVRKELGIESQTNNDKKETDYESAKDTFEKAYFEELLVKHKNNIAAVAREAKLHYVTTHRKLKAHELIAK